MQNLDLKNFSWYTIRPFVFRMSIRLFWMSSSVSFCQDWISLSLISELQRPAQKASTVLQMYMPVYCHGQKQERKIDMGFIRMLKATYSSGYFHQQEEQMAV